MDIPFIYGRLAEKESFIDRVEDRRELKNFLRHGINVILVSPRRWGKSSLVRTSMEELMQEESKTKVCLWMPPRFIRRRNSTTNLPPS